jgi:hypothetical protein
MATYISSTSVSTVVCTQKSKQSLPRSAREAVLSGFDILGASFSAQDNFTGANTLIRTGEIEPCPGLTIPFVANIAFRPDANGRRSYRDVRNAVLGGFDLLAASYSAHDQFTGPDTVVRRGEIEFEDGLKIPFVAKIKFGRPR